MKRNVVAFLGKEGYAIGDLQNQRKTFTTHFLVEGVEDDLVLCLANEPNEVDWAKLFDEFNIEKAYFKQKSVKGVLFVKVENRYVIFTFGYGRGLIEKTSTERGFGLRVSMNIGDPEQLKSVDKSTLDRVSRNTRSQVSLNSGIQDFDFEFDHEILKAITAIVKRSDDQLELVSGNDSVSLYTEIEFDRFRDIAGRLVDAYFSDEYKKKYPWAEFLGLERDPDIVQELEAALVDKLNLKELDDFWIAPPRIVNYEDFAGFSYNLKPAKGCSICLHPEMNLQAFLEEAPFKKNRPITVSALKSKEIYVLNGELKNIDNYTVFESLNGEVDLRNQKYVLHDGHWYHVKQSFAEEVEEYYEKLRYWDGFHDKPYHDLRECCYLRRISDHENIAVLDQHWVRQKDVPQDYEFCDLITQCDRLIHVKRYGGSSVLSHLFAQATMGIQMMLNCPEVIPQVQKHLENTYVSFDFSHAEPRKHKIVLGIIQERKGRLHLPFFSKVNLRHHVREIENKGFKVELAKIPIDKQKFLDVKEKGAVCRCREIDEARRTSEL